MLQESGAKRPRPDGAAAPLEVAAEGTAGPAFASLGAQDVNTINTTGQTMQPAPEASAAEVAQPCPMPQTFIVRDKSKRALLPQERTLATVCLMQFV